MAQVTIAVDPAELHAANESPWENGDDFGIAMTGISAEPTLAVPEAVRDAFWRWYDQHSEDSILKKRILFWAVEVRVKHLRPLLERFFGQHP